MSMTIVDYFHATLRRQFVVDPVYQQNCPPGTLRNALDIAWYVGITSAGGSRGLTRIFQSCKR